MPIFYKCNFLLVGRLTVKLRLELNSFDESKFPNAIERCEQSGITFESMSSLGDTDSNRIQLYQLNKTCSTDIPGRGVFFTYEEYCEKRFGVGYDPKTVLLALHNETWVGMTASSIWPLRKFVFNEMTGVLRDYRRQGIALALKLLGIRHAKNLNVDFIYTIHDAENIAPIELNRRLGYVDVEWDQLPN